MKDLFLEKITDLILSYSQGDLDRRIEVSDESGELEAIAVGLNMLGEELSFSRQQLTLREKKLQETLVEVQNTNKELEQFAYIVSHDLQEPLRMISGFLKLLEVENVGKLDEESKQYIRFAVDGAERMKTLINELLEYSRIGTNTEQWSLTDLNEIVTNVIHVLAEKIQEKNAVVNIKALPLVLVNKTMINQLFLNLLTNAIKYQDSKNPTVEIGCEEEVDKWTFYVKDNGIGIEPQYFETIFNMFQRVGEKAAYSGTGIGLAICKKVVQAHGGAIWVESEPGKGSIFYFTIPKLNDDSTGNMGAR